MALACQLLAPGSSLLTILLRAAITQDQSSDPMSDAIPVPDPAESISPLQQAIIERSQELCRQQTMNSKGNRFHYPILVNFAVLALIHGGRKFYEMLHANFQGIFPSIRTVGNRISRFRVPTKEGVVYVTPVKQFIEDNKVPPVISISEDATAVTLFWVLVFHCNQMACRNQVMLRLVHLEILSTCLKIMIGLLLL